MFPEFFRHLAPFPLLNVKHDPESFPGLVRPELVDEVMHVDEQQVEVFNLLFPPGGIWHLDEEVDQVLEVYQDRMIQLPQLALPINLFGRIEPPDALALQ